MIEMMRSDETRARRRVSPIHSGLTERHLLASDLEDLATLEPVMGGWKAVSPATTFRPTITPEGDEPDNACRCYASHRRAGRPAREVEAILQSSTGLLAECSRSGYCRNEEQNSRGRNRRAESYCNSTYCIALQSRMIRRCEVRYLSKRAQSAPPKDPSFQQDEHRRIQQSNVSSSSTENVCILSRHSPCRSLCVVSSPLPMPLWSLIH
jgi:hypothetical protein